jgi:hypothetical protein
MMATYAEYLKSQGASEEEIKILDTAIARRAYERMEEAVVRLDSEAKAAKAGANKYHEEVDTWFKKHDEEFKSVESKMVAESARAAKAEAALRVAHERGMLDVAKDLGYNFDAPPVPDKSKEAQPIDTSKFVTTDNIASLTERAGDGLAVLQDIVLEHMQLFPTQPLKVRELRSAAVKANKSVEQYWLETFKVDEARAAQTKRIADAHEAELRKQITETVSAEFASKYGNPDLRPLHPSTNFLTPRPAANREKAPWETGLDGEGGSSDRVRRATANALKMQQTH